MCPLATAVMCPLTTGCSLLLLYTTTIYVSSCCYYIQKPVEEHSQGFHYCMRPLAAIYGCSLLLYMCPLAAAICTAVSRQRRSCGASSRGQLVHMCRFTTATYVSSSYCYIYCSLPLSLLCVCVCLYLGNNPVRAAVTHATRPKP